MSKPLIDTVPENLDHFPEVGSLVLQTSNAGESDCVKVEPIEQSLEELTSDLGPKLMTYVDEKVTSQSPDKVTDLQEIQPLDTAPTDMEYPNQNVDVLKPKVLDHKTDDIKPTVEARSNDVSKAPEQYQTNPKPNEVTLKEPSQVKGDETVPEEATEPDIKPAEVEVTVEDVPGEERVVAAPVDTEILEPSEDQVEAVPVESEIQEPHEEQVEAAPVDTAVQEPSEEQVVAVPVDTAIQEPHKEQVVLPETAGVIPEPEPDAQLSAPFHFRLSRQP